MYRTSGFGRLSRKKYIIVLWGCFLILVSRLKTGGASHLLPFFVKNPKEESMKIVM